MKWIYPTTLPTLNYISFEAWRNQTSNFFIPEIITPEITPSELVVLKEKVDKIQNSQFQHFSDQWYSLTGWHTNPLTGYNYPKSLHWTKIQDFSMKSGDIKYVWEKSRFTFLFDLIRFDAFSGEDQSDLVFSLMNDWIDQNPTNQGPNWRCSQEISLRVLNWIFALEYYGKRRNVADSIFQKILNSINHQMQHVAANLDFAKIAVRNNHILTEALGLYVTGSVLPFFAQSLIWKQKGKQIFEEEIIYQIREEGTYLQHSMNYHRVVVQLLTWFIRISKVNNDPIDTKVLLRAKASFQFLNVCQDPTSGWLPNYGNNDGALFFPLSSCHFRDFRPQLFALAKSFSIDYQVPKSVQEEAFWMGLIDSKNQENPCFEIENSIINNFSENGYYVLKEERTITFLRNTSYSNRPFQADNMHLDIWENGINILRDAGTYQYNTDEQRLRYFAGTVGHNTVMLDAMDQMRKGARFIWYDWIKESGGSWYFDNSSNKYIFDGYYIGFSVLGNNIKHRRRITKTPNHSTWIVEDWIEGVPAMHLMRQLWHPNSDFFTAFSIKATDADNGTVNVKEEDGWYSERYGQLEKVVQLVFETNKRYLKTIICKL